VYKAFGPLVDVRAQIERRFAEDIDDKKLVTAAVRAGIDAMVETLHDAHAIYLDEKEYERFKKRTDGVFGGIGVDVWPAEKGLEVLSREPNSPATVAGLLPGDIITHVDGKATNQVSLVDAVNNLLNGPPDTEATLTITRPGEPPAGGPRDITLRRAVIHLDPIRGWSRSPTGDWRFMLDEQAHVAYIRLTKFTGDVDERLDERMNRLLREGVRGVVLDLRENTGGLLTSAIEVADRFLEAGLIVSTRGRKSDEKRWYATHDIGYPDLPMAVLINESTASAAEIVAGALRDHHRAEVVGERSYGKGSVQEVVELDRHSGAIKLTTAYYYLPSGQCIQKTPKAVQEGDWGVAPTLPVNLTPRQRERWRRVWHEIGREVVARPTSRPVTATVRETEDAECEKEAAALLKADLQLRQALECVQRQLARGRTRSTTTSSRETAE
jgi:carboxyl-terminal processing protease